MARKRSRSDKKRGTRQHQGARALRHSRRTREAADEGASGSGLEASPEALAVSDEKPIVELETGAVRIGSEQEQTPLVVDRVEAALSPTDLVSLGHSFRRVTGLIEEVGRTLEAQNQRAQRLMERLESLASTLEVLPHEAERQLEALDALQRSIEASAVPTERLRLEIGRGLPDVAQAVREGGKRLEDRWARAAEAVVAQLDSAQRRTERTLSESARRFAQQVSRVHAAAERRAEQRFAQLVRSQRWQTGVLAGFAGALLVVVGSLFLFGVGSSLPARTVAADTAKTQWRLERVGDERGSRSAGDAAKNARVSEGVVTRGR